MAKSTPPPDKAGRKAAINIITSAKSCWGIGEIQDFNDIAQKIEEGDVPDDRVSTAHSLNKELEIVN